MAFIEFFGRPIKVDDISVTLARKAKRHGSRTTKQLASNEFFVAFLDKATVEALMAAGHIRGDGFTLIVNHWNQFRGGERHNLKLKVYATLHNLPLFCWTAEAVVTII